MFRSIRQWFLAPKTSKRNNRRRLSFDILEDRMVPASRTVTTLADPVPPPARNEFLTLRRAITELNASNDASNSIGFAAGLQGYVNLQSELPHIQRNISINGGGVINVHRAVEALFRIFAVDAGNQLDLLNIEATNGYVEGNGGGIYVAENATANLYEVPVTGNTAEDSGGAIYNEGTLTVENSYVEFNSARFGGGIYNAGTLFVQWQTTVSSNGARDGGGIYNSADSSTTISNATIHWNTATQLGGGILNSGTLIMSNTAMSHNIAAERGGALYCTAIVSTATLTSVTLTDENMATNINGTSEGGGFFVGAAATLTLNSCTVSGNMADDTDAVGGLVQANATYTTINCTITDTVKQL